MKLPLISVVMPVYNAAPYLIKSARSILDQTHKNLELLMVDDASSDDSLRVIKDLAEQDTRITYRVNEINQGYLRSCNELFDMTKGDFITFQDADDWSDCTRLEKQLTAFNQDSELGLCGTYDEIVFTGDRSSMIKRRETVHERILEGIKKQNQFCGASIMITRKAFEAVGGYREYFDRIGNEDYDWSARIVERFKAINLPESLYTVYASENSISRTIRTPRQLVSDQLVQHLLRQRAENQGQDATDGLDLSTLTQFERDIVEPYERDPSLFHRKCADLYYYNQDINAYFLSSYQAMLSKPLLIINWKYFIKAIWNKFQVGGKTRTE